MDAGEQHLEEGGVAIRRAVVASTVVCGREDSVPPDTFIAEASDTQRGEEVALPGEQVAHAEAKDGDLVPGTKREADEEEAAAGAADSDREWAAEPEPGVLMTLVSRGDGTNHLRRIRFSEEYFGDAWAAQSWWADNCDRIVELYSVVVQPEHPSHSDEDDDDDPAAPVTPCQSEDDDHQHPVRV